jgi:hypothetical protein
MPEVETAAAPPVAPLPPPNPARGQPAAEPIAAALAEAEAELAGAAAVAPKKVEAPAATLADIEDFTDPGGHTGLPATSEILEILPDVARKLVGNLKADYSRKTAAAASELASMRAQLEAATQRGIEQEQRLARLDSPEFRANLDRLQDEGRAAAADDPFSPEGKQAIIKAEAAKLFAEFLEPVQKQFQADVATATANAQKARSEAYIAANPEIRDNPEVRAGIIGLLKQPENASMTLSMAHRLVLGERAIKEAAALRGLSDADRAGRAATLAQTGGGTVASAGAKEPEFTNVKDALRYLQAQGMT